MKLTLQHLHTFPPHPHSHPKHGQLICSLFFTAVLLLSSCWFKLNYCFASRAKSCSECLQAGKGCAYCPDETFNGPRCDHYEKIFALGCSAAAIITAKSSMMIEESRTINTRLQQSQVSPQRMSMTFLPGEEKVMDVEVFAPTKGPLDLYILMDFSNSMADDLDNLKRMGKELASLVEKLSDDYTIGFGKFVDKVIEPQTDMRPSKLKEPWPNSDPPFAFQNVIKLTKDLDFFTSELQNERISGNLDPPEGGFDAILQAAVCGDKIGWRNHSTHLLVFSTESAFHYEGDGANVLSGILPRNDELCHLDAAGKYTEDVKQDYPSVPTLVRILGKHNIIPILAVTNHSYTYYEKLKEYFPIAEVGLLHEDSANILQVMEIAFENIRSKMSIRAEDRPKAFEAQFLSTSGSVAEYGAFDFKPGAIGKFQMRLKAQQMIDEQPTCKMAPNEREGTIRVKPTTFNAAVNVKASINKSPRCHGNGDLVCGKCRCYNNWRGTFCNCSESTSSQDSALCKGPQMTEPCSGRGDCECGTCVCYNPDQFEGPYCQYDKTQCPRFGGFLCFDRGSCVMGRCACIEGWTGNACECPKSNQTCLDSKGGVCNGRGKCVCGRCDCPDSGFEMSSTCEPNFQLGVCEATRSCVQCQAWKTGEKKDKEECDKCPFKIVMVDELKERGEVLDSCSFRDEDDDCTYYYTVDNSKDSITKVLEVQVLKKKGELRLCLYCLCCPWTMLTVSLSYVVFSAGRMVGFKEDEYLLRQSLLTSDHLDTPMVRTGPPKGTDVVRWKVTDNVHRGFNHPQALIKPNPKETIQFPISLRLNRLFSDNLSRPDSREAEQLRKEVSDNLNEVYKQIPGAQKVQKTAFRQDYTMVDTVLSAPRSTYPDIVKLTEKNVQSGNFQDLKVVPGYYTVATDREAAGAIEFQEGVESVDVHVPLFVKDEDDDKKQLQVEAMDVPLGIAEIGKRLVNITIIKEHATSVFSFLQPAYTYSRQDGVANIPISREIIEDGRTQVTYRTRDLTAKDKKDYLTVEGDLNYGPGETQKTVPVQLLELGEKDGLLEDKPVKQFVMDLSNPRQGAKLGRYPRTTVTITDHPGEWTQAALFDPSSNASIGERKTTIVNVTDGGKTGWGDYNLSQKHATKDNVKWHMWSFCGVSEFLCEYLLHPLTSAFAVPRSPDIAQMQEKGYINRSAASPGGRLLSPANPKAKATGPRSIRLNWDPPPGNPMGYKVKYWIYGDPEKDAQVIDVKTPQAELTNLYPYCDYEMRVCAYNAIGDGQNTDIVTCQTLEDVPGEPGRLAFNVISPTVTQLSWAEPAETNGNITAYEVIYTPIDDEMKPVGPAKKVNIDNPKKRMLLIENLQNAQTYQYKVRAKNSVGWGPFRDATINLASQPARPLSIPIIPDVPIVDAEAGDEYDSYLMYSNEVLKSPGGSKTPSVSGDGEYPEPKPQATAKSGFSYAGMQSSSQSQFGYSLSQSSRTRTHSSDVNEALYNLDRVLHDARVSPGVPDTPSRLVFSALGPTALKVSWQEPHCEKDILGYCVLYQLLNGGEVKRINVTNPAENSVIIQDLLPNHSYIFKVKAQSQEGWGPEREGVITIESAVDPKSPLCPMPGSPFTLSTPSAPGPLVFTALSPDSLQLSWEKPRKPNGDILGYVVTCEQLHGGGDMRTFQVNGDGAETSLTVPNLTENVPYKFKVQARTTQGFGPEREGIITIESQDGKVFHMPGEVTTRTNVSHTMLNDPYFSDGMMMTTQHTETSGMVTRHVTKEVVQRSVMGGATVTKKMFYES
uniref:Integrin beta n=1 Tax=Anabas testudineus TaxID=64144 RepID=A0A7N6F6Q9_ANATE